METEKINLSAKSEKHPGGIRLRHIYKGDDGGDILFVSPGFGGSRKLFGKNHTRNIIERYKEEGKPKPHVVYTHYPSHKFPTFDPKAEKIAESLSQALTQSELLSHLLQPIKDQPSPGVHFNTHSLGTLIALDTLAQNPALAARTRTFTAYGAPYNGLSSAKILFPYKKLKQQVRSIQTGSAFLKRFEERQKSAYPDQRPPFEIYNFAAEKDQFVTMESAHACPLKATNISVTGSKKFPDGQHRSQVEDGQTASYVATKMQDANPEKHATRLKELSQSSWQAFIKTFDTQHLHKLLCYSNELKNIVDSNENVSLSPNHTRLLRDTALAFQQTYRTDKQETDLHGMLDCHKQLRELNPSHSSNYDNKDIDILKKHSGIIYKGVGKNAIEIERLHLPQGDGGPNSPSYFFWHGYGDGLFACGRTDGKPVSVFGRAPDMLKELPPGKCHVIHYPTASAHCDDPQTIASKTNEAFASPYLKNLLQEGPCITGGHSFGGLIAGEFSLLRKLPVISIATPWNGLRNHLAPVKLAPDLDPQLKCMTGKTYLNDLKKRLNESPDTLILPTHLYGDGLVPISSSLPKDILTNKPPLDLPPGVKMHERGYVISDAVLRLAPDLSHRGGVMGDLRTTFHANGKEYGSPKGNATLGKLIGAMTQHLSAAGRHNDQPRRRTTSSISSIQR